MLIPTLAFQLDPLLPYYPDPDKFDPEPFSEENKHKISPITYMPFGNSHRANSGSVRVLKMSSEKVKCISCNIVINELLCFIKNKIDIMD